MKENTARQESLRRLREDWLRPLRLVETLDTGTVFANSPVEIEKEYVVSDRENGDLFLILVFRSVSRRPIAALDIRLQYYGEHQALPFRTDNFRYNHETAMLGKSGLRARRRKRAQAIGYGESFGQGVCLPLPEDYCHRIRIELVGATYDDGSYELLKLLAGGRAKRFEEMDSGLRASYEQVNIYERRESAHPTRVLPQEGKNAWLCCCGHKNPAGTDLCETCKREKGWQMETLSEEHLRQVRRELDEEEQQLLQAGKKRVLHDTSAYSRSHYDSAEDRDRKAVQTRRAKWNLFVEREMKAALLLRKVFIALFFLGLLVGAILVVREIVYAAYRMGFYGGAEALKKLLGDEEYASRYYMISWK